MSRMIDADELRKNVLKWLPPDPCGREEKEHPFEEDICVSMLMEIDEQEPIDAIPCDFIRELIRNPDYAGSKSRILSWLLERWKNETKGNN